MVEYSSPVGFPPPDGWKCAYKNFTPPRLYLSRGFAKNFYTFYIFIIRAGRRDRRFLQIQIQSVEACGLARPIHIIRRNSLRTSLVFRPKM